MSLMLVLITNDADVSLRMVHHVQHHVWQLMMMNISTMKT